MIINKDNLQVFKKDLLNAIKDLEKKYGVTIEYDGTTYGDNSFRTSIKVTNVGEDGIPTETKQALNDLDWFREIYGKSFRDGRHTFKVVGYEYGKKYPIKCERDDGNSYSFVARIYSEKEFF